MRLITLEGRLQQRRSLLIVKRQTDQLKSNWTVKQKYRYRNPGSRKHIKIVNRQPGSSLRRSLPTNRAKGSILRP